MIVKARLALAVLLVGGALILPPARQLIEVTPGSDLQEVLRTAPSRSIIRLSAGSYEGPIAIDRPVTLTGPREAVISAPLGADAAITVSAGGAVVEGVAVRGGWTGIDVLSASGTRIRDVLVEGADAQGIRIYRRSATVERVEVRDLVDPHAQGIEILSAPEVAVRDSIVRGGKVGIVGHLSTVRFERNLVTGTKQVAIMIREMGSGVAVDNRVREASGAGLYCGDMSRCEFAGNDVALVTAADSTRSGGGWGLVVHYHSTASTTDDTLEGVAGAAVALGSSRMVPSTPLDLGSGAQGLFAGLWAALLALLALCVLYAISRWLVPPDGWEAPPVERLAQIAVAILLVGLAVQSFHMVEHWLQLYRVRFDGVPSRGGLAGRVADVEWVHLAYNAAVLVGFGALLHLRKRGWAPGGTSVRGDRLLVAAILLQGYHVVEHSLKVWQHVATGAKVNPGLLGQHADLVLVHFGINAAVYLAFVALCYVYLEGSRFVRRSRSGLQPGVAV